MRGRALRRRRLPSTSGCRTSRAGSCSGATSPRERSWDARSPAISSGVSWSPTIWSRRLWTRHSLAAGRGYILEGFPRALSQARTAEARLGAGLADAVVFLDLPDDVARQRIAQRMAAGRSDDRDRAVVERRLRTFHAETDPVVDHYRDRRLLVTVDAAQPPDAVTAAILAALDGIAQRRRRR